MKKYFYTISLLLLFLFNMVLLLPLLEEGFILGHDNTSHYVYSLRLAEMMSEGNFRFWLPDFSMGMPLFYYYQPIPHFTTATIFLLFSGIDALLLMKGILVVLFSLLPLSLYQSFRWMGLPKSICLISAFLTFTIESWVGLGFEMRSILGWGLYAQLWGMVLAPLTIGYIYKEYFGARRLFVPITLLGVLILTHVLSGIIACLSIAILFLISEWNKIQKIQDSFYLTKIYIGAFAIAAVILVPTLLGGDYISGYFKLGEEHHLGLGLIKTVTYLITGQILDANRLPVLTLLLVSGLLLYLYLIPKQVDKKQSETGYRFILLNFGMAFFLLAGAKTFTFLQYTPLYKNLPFLRMLNHLHFFSLPIIAFMMVQSFQFFKNKYQENKIQFSLNKVLTIAGFIPLMAVTYFLASTHVKIFELKATTHIEENKAYQEAMSYLKSQPHGRVNVTNIKEPSKYYAPTFLADKPIGRFYAAGGRSNLGQFYTHKFNNAQSHLYQSFGFHYILTTASQDYSKIGCLDFENEAYKVYTVSDKPSYFDVIQSNTVTLTHNQPARYLLSYWMKQKSFFERKNHITIGEEHTRKYFEAQGFEKFMTLQRNDQRLSAARFTIENKAKTESIESVVDMNDKGLSQYLNAQLDSLSENGLGTILEEYTEEGYYQSKIEVFPTEHNTPQWAMVKVNAHPDWKAKVNGQPVEWVQMSPCFMAVPVTAGTHTVEFEFGVSPLRIGLFCLSIFTIIGLGLFEFVQARRKRKSQKQDQKELSYA